MIWPWKSGWAKPEHDELNRSDGHVLSFSVAIRQAVRPPYGRDIVRTVGQHTASMLPDRLNAFIAPIG